jgi:transposase
VYDGGATRAGCWMHTRRYVFEARLSDPGRAHEALARVRALYAVEADARARNITAAALAGFLEHHL